MISYKIVIPFLGAFVLSAIFTFGFIPVLSKLKAGQSIRNEGPKSHMAKSGTPTMGGIAIILSVVIMSLIVGGFNYNLLVILIGYLGFALLGFFDDFIKVMKKRNLGLTSIQKLLFQILIAAAVSVYYMKTDDNATEILVPFLSEKIDLGFLFLPFAIFVIVAMSNSVNLTDGLDGLAAGTVAIVSITFGIISVLVSAVPSAIFFLAAAGGCLGFLIWNKNPAKIFMGDTGSLALGGGLAIACMFMKGELFLPIICLTFALETLSVILQVGSFKIRGKRIFKMAPLHHHFELSGFSERNVVMMFYIFTFVCSMIGIFVFFVFS